MAVRNSWVDVCADGRRSDVGTGPRARDGQMTIDLKVREDGGILDLLHIACIGSQDGKTVIVEVTDRRTGRTVFLEQFNQ